MNQLLKLILSGILILSFLKMPYAFYAFSDYILFAGFGWLAYDAFERRDHFDVKIYIMVALLYNPFVKFPIPHLLWNIINAVVIIALIINIVFAGDYDYEDYTKKDDQ